MKIFKTIIFLFFNLKLFSQCPPHISATISPAFYILNCFTPTILATGTSTTPDTQISWIVPSTPSLINSSTVILGPPNGPATSSLSLFYANYTVVATNTALACTSSSIIVVNQNFSPPWLTPTLLINPPVGICNYTSSLTFSNQPFVQNGFMPVFLYLWQGPTPQASLSGDSFVMPPYLVQSSGTYSFIVTNNSNWNGCSKTFTINVADVRPQFGLQGTAPTSSASCNGSVIVTTQVPNGYTLSATSGSLSGTTINNLCYGWVKVCMTFTDTQCFKCDSILMNAATSLNEIDFDNEISIYPNPTSSSFFIKNNSNKNVSVKIFDLEGREIEPVASRASATVKEAGIEIKNLKPGIYFIEINLEGIFVRKKIVITK